MTTYSAIAATQIDADSFIDTTLATQWTNNFIAALEGDSSASAVRLHGMAMADLVSSTTYFTFYEKYPDGVSALSITSAYYTKVWEFICHQPGVINVGFSLKATSGDTVYGRIFVNGVAVGTVRSTTSTSYVSYTEDITVARGDKLQIYIHSTYYAGYLSKILLKSENNSVVYPGCESDV